ncbi:nuclear protein 96-domain-containing protein [Geopyxis carbonaria]|nr:nuclear protein 96-domain-containing protein [Geopyxis carbonaria]
MFGSTLGNSTAQPNLGGSLFGGNTQQQQQPQTGNLLGGSLFNSQQNQQQQQQQAFSTSVADSPYGNSLLSSMGGSQHNSPLGPIATPLGSQTKKAAMIPHHKIAPRNPTLTPRLGNSYSRSGSPFAASISNTSLGAGSLSRSFSTNNKLNLFESDDSVLSPNAFTPGSNSRVAGLKKLVIDKKIRDQDLFVGSPGSRPRQPQLESVNGRGTKGILKKTVSFDMASENRISDEDLYGSPSSAPVRETNGPSPSAAELGYIRSTPDRRRPRETEDDTPTGNVSGHNGQSVVGNEVALVQQPSEDKSRGTYWMVPSAAKMRTLSSELKKKVIGLTVGRRGYGEVRFEHPVDLTQLDFDYEQIPGTVVTFEQRVCTVYPEGLEKPPPGKGLNVPAQITLEDCFPMTKNERGKIRDPEHPRYITHIRRLKNIKDTEFVNYLAEEGIWIFKVMHFTTYGLTGEEEEDEEGDVTLESEGTSRQYSDEDSMDADISGVTGSEFDDTFDFKKLNSSARQVPRDPFPGSFVAEEEDSYDQYSEEDDSQILDGDVTLNGQSFLGEGSVGSIEEDDEPAEPMEDSNMLEYSTMIVEEDEEEDEGEQTIGSIEYDDSTVTIQSPTKTSPSKAISATPKALPMGKDWTEQLNNTISPVKRRYGGTNFSAINDKVASPVKRNVIEPLNYGLLDLHDDLYGSPAKSAAVSKSTMRKTRKREQIESPGDSVFRPEGVRPTTRPSTSAGFPSGEKFDHDKLEDTEQQWRKAVRPVWSRDGTLIYMGQLEGLPMNRKNDDCLRVAKVDYGLRTDAVPKALTHQLAGTTITIDQDGVPFASPTVSVPLGTYTKLSWSQDRSEQYEKNIWKLASALWDPVQGVPPQGEDHMRESYLFEKCRKENVSRLLQELVNAEVDAHVLNATTAEEAALAHLTAHRIEQACQVLIEAGNFRLATLLPMIGGNKKIRGMVRLQIETWQKRGVTAEISVPIRALYELVSGETCYSQGVSKPIEDAAPEFWFAEQFKLNWKRVFGLKLWYGTMEHEDIAAAVQAYEADVEAHPTKLTIPKPWYNPSAPDTNIDILWGLLKLYSDSKLPLDSVFSPQNFLSGNPLDMRLPWQLRTLLASRGTNDFADSEMQDGPSPVFAAGMTAQKMTTDFAEALEAAGDWHWAIFIIMHLASTSMRSSLIRDILARHIAEDEDSQLAWLTRKLLIPATWISEAKALHARHAGLHIAEAEYLLAARQFNEAHKTVVTQVAPAGIISGDIAPLRKILGRFDINAVDSWGIGGQVYLDYIRLLEIERTQLGKSKMDQEKGVITQRLLGALKGIEKRGFLQNVAVTEMAGTVASVVLKGSTELSQEKARVLELPLGEDNYLKKSVDLSLKYFNTRLSTGRS